MPAQNCCIGTGRFCVNGSNGQTSIIIRKSDIREDLPFSSGDVVEFHKPEEFTESLEGCIIVKRRDKR